MLRVTSLHSAARLWVHALALAVVLFVAVQMLDNGHLISADEGAVLSQVEILRSDGRWGMVNPAARIDPDGRWFGIDISTRSGDRYYPYVKHPAYPAAMSPLYELGGTRLMLAASTLGTLVCAVLAALLSRRFRPGFDVATLWVVGLLSPLFFDANWLIAHSTGAAFATGAVLAALAAVCDGRRAAPAAVAVCVAAAAAFRSEGMLFGIALGVACGVVAVVGRNRLALATALAAGGAAVGVWWADARIYSALVGTSVEPFAIRTAEGDSWVVNRLRGLWASVIRPQLMAPTAAGACFLAIALLSVIGAVYVRQRPTEHRLIRGAAVLAGFAAVVALTRRPAPVPGLLVAFPLLPVGLMLLRRRHLESVAARVVLGTAALFGGAIVATQYPVGGSMEWGGRYFHLVLPIVVPLLLVAVRDAVASVDRTTARVLATTGLVVAVALSVFAVGSIVRLRSDSRTMAEGIASVARSSTSDPDGPVVVSELAAVGRFLWKDAVHQRFIAVPTSEELATVAQQLQAAGVDTFVFASPSDTDEGTQRLEGYEPSRVERFGQWTATVMVRA